MADKYFHEAYLKKMNEVFKNEINDQGEGDQTTRSSAKEKAKVITLQRVGGALQLSTARPASSNATPKVSPASNSKPKARQSQSTNLATRSRSRSAARQGQSHQAIQCYGERNQVPPPPPPGHPPSTHVRRPIGSCSGSTQQMWWRLRHCVYDLQYLILWHYELESYVFCESCFLCVYTQFSCSRAFLYHRHREHYSGIGQFSIADARRSGSDFWGGWSMHAEEKNRVILLRWEV